MYWDKIRYKIITLTVFVPYDDTDDWIDGYWIAISKRQFYLSKKGHWAQFIR